MSLPNTEEDVRQLKPNSGKTEIILFGTKQKLKLVDVSFLLVAGTRFIVSESPNRISGTIFNSSLSVTGQVNNCIKTTVFHLRNISTT